MDFRKKIIIYAAVLGGLAVFFAVGTIAGQAGRAQMTDNIGSLAGFLDVNRDGSVADDVLGFVGKLFKQ